MSSTESKTEGRGRRLFFALWPDVRVRAALARVQRELVIHGKPVRAPNLHLTMMFLGQVDADTQQCVETAASNVRAEPIRFALDSSGHWRRARISWLAPSVQPAALETLAHALHDALSECGFAAPTRDFKAHVTLARKVLRAPPEHAFAPIHWRANDFVLVESCSGEKAGQYRIVRRWRLR